MRNFISSKSETLPMFGSPVLEFFSRVRWFVPLTIYIPLVAALAYLSVFVQGVSVWGLLGLFATGVLVWTLVEYILHRFLFHYHPTSRLGKRIIWMTHGVHHDYPSDPLRLVMPPAASIPLAALLYGLFHLMLGGRYTPGFMSGFFVGYLIYDLMHYAIHHIKVNGSIFSKIKEHHMRHHFSEPERGFGVSSMFWDAVFHTQFGERTRPKATEILTECGKDNQA